MNKNGRGQLSMECVGGVDQLPQFIELSKSSVSENLWISMHMDTSPGIFVNVNLTDCLLFNFIMALLRKKKGFSKKKISR